MPPLVATQHYGDNGLMASEPRSIREKQSETECKGLSWRCCNCVSAISYFQLDEAQKIKRGCHRPFYSTPSLEVRSVRKADHAMRHSPINTACGNLNGSGVAPLSR